MNMYRISGDLIKHIQFAYNSYIFEKAFECRIVYHSCVSKITPSIKHELTHKS